MSEPVLVQRDRVAEQLMLALARREHHNRATARLTEPGLPTWKAFRGNLSYHHLLALLAEDAAVRFPLPADVNAVLQASTTQSLADIPANTVVHWLDQLTVDRLGADRADALAAMARALGLPHRFAGASLHKLQSATRVLELPGTGGQLIARALERSPDAVLHVNGTVLTSGWADRAMAGLVAMELDAPHQRFIHDDPDLSWAADPDNRSRFDLVFGLLPEKGGHYDKNALEQRFPVSTIVLV